MKKLLKICAAVLAAVTVLSLAGCSARSPITADEFSKQAKTAGFTVKEQDVSSIANADKCIDATKTESGTEIIFISYKTESAAQEMYTSMKSKIAEGTSGTSTNLDSASYSKYTLVNGELNHTLSRMGSTLVYGKATTSVKDQVDSLFKTIKY